MEREIISRQISKDSYSDFYMFPKLNIYLNVFYVHTYYKIESIIINQKINIYIGDYLSIDYYDDSYKEMDKITQKYVYKINLKKFIHINEICVNLILNDDEIIESDASILFDEENIINEISNELDLKFIVMDDSIYDTDIKYTLLYYDVNLKRSCKYIRKGDNDKIIILKLDDDYFIEKYNEGNSIIKIQNDLYDIKYMYIVAIYKGVDSDDDTTFKNEIFPKYDIDIKII
jgi:hypothetical protein